MSGYFASDALRAQENADSIILQVLNREVARLRCFLDSQHYAVHWICRNGPVFQVNLKVEGGRSCGCGGELVAMPHLAPLGGPWGDRSEMHRLLLAVSDRLDVFDPTTGRSYKVEWVTSKVNGCYELELSDDEGEASDSCPNSVPQ